MRRLGKHLPLLPRLRTSCTRPYQPVAEGIAGRCHRISRAGRIPGWALAAVRLSAAAGSSWPPCARARVCASAFQLMPFGAARPGTAAAHTECSGGCGAAGGGGGQSELEAWARRPGRGSCCPCSTTRQQSSWSPRARRWGCSTGCYSSPSCCTCSCEFLGTFLKQGYMGRGRCRHRGLGESAFKGPWM